MKREVCPILGLELNDVDEQYIKDEKVSPQKIDDAFVCPTLIEKILNHYPLSSKFSTLLVAVFIGPLGNFIFLFSVSNNLQNAFYRTFGYIDTGKTGYIMGIQFNWHSFVSNMIWYIFLFYVAFSIRQLRLTLVNLEPKLLSLTSDGERTPHEIFRIVSQPFPQLIITSLFMLIYATSVPDLIRNGELTTLSTPIFILRSLFRSLMFGSVLWLYFSSLWGLYHFGKQCLRFKPYLEDPMLGVGEVGTAAFAFSKVYFVGLSLFTAQMVLGGMIGHTSSVNFVVLLILVPAGIALFLAPLISTHNRMVDAKKVELRSIRKLLSELVYQSAESNEREEPPVSKLLTFEALDKKAASISTWPFESQAIGKLVAIMLSVIAIILARLIQILFQI